MTVYNRTKIQRFRNKINRRSSSKQFCTSFKCNEILNQLKHLNINKDDIRRGLINTRWPGRIEKILNDLHL